jgi:hypothetical protein
MNQNIPTNAAPFSGATSTEHPDEAATPDISETAMDRLRSPFQTDTGLPTNPDGRRRGSAQPVSP